MTGWRNLVLLGWVALPHPSSPYPSATLRAGKGEGKRGVPHSVPLLCKEGGGEVEANAREESL